MATSNRQDDRGVHALSAVLRVNNDLDIRAWRVRLADSQRRDDPCHVQGDLSVMYYCICSCCSRQFEDVSKYSVVCHPCSVFDMEQEELVDADKPPHFDTWHCNDCGAEFSCSVFVETTSMGTCFCVCCGSECVEVKE